MKNKIQIKNILRMKNHKKITMLTAYDYPLASVIDRSGIDMILVGDSLANVVLGLNSTKEVGMAEMLHHTKAVTRAVKHALVIGDMPYSSYQLNPKNAVKNAERFILEAKCGAVKIEWFEKCLEVTANIINAGIPVMGHIGLTPQTADKLGGFKVQGKDAQKAAMLIKQAKLLEKCGCFALVLECIPDKIAKIITKSIKIPTIGIGAGKYCDGQVLVSYDILGLFEGFRPKFVKQYINLMPLIQKAIDAYRSDVQKGKFPGLKQSFKIEKKEVLQLESLVNIKNLC